MINGIIVINKPQGFTSFDVVAIVRGCFHTKKVGHSGTLDPMANGVLPVFIGSATKAISILPDHSKSYRAGFRLGVTSDTLDVWGNCTEEMDVLVSERLMRSVLEKFKGDIMQVPPMYSALKVNGQKLCDLARKGIEVEREPRPVTISKLELSILQKTDGIIDIECSSGTYIRSLIDDIGKELGCGAVMTSLLRTKACGFEFLDSVDIEKLKYYMTDEERAALVRPVDSVFTEYPEIRLDSEQERLYLNGARLDTARLDCDNGDIDDGKRYRVYGDKFIGIADAVQGELIPVKRLMGD